MESDTHEVISLDDSRASDPEAVGQKAATLARLRAAGHPVPDGFVLTTAACDALAAESAERIGQVDENLRRRLDEALSKLGGGPVAVRSSGVAEDLAGASYAGQYETVLGVRDLDALCEAVRTCIASTAAARVRAYAGTEQRSSMAVLIQRQVPAAAAGVAFSANPVTGDRDETLVSAVTGLGDRLVSGEATPDEWVVRDGSAEATVTPEQALDEEQVREIAALTDRLETEEGAPQDIEWAIADGSVHLLQSRPITALPEEPDLDVPTEGTWTKDEAHYSDLMTPLGASIYLPRLDAGINQMFAEYGLLLDHLENRSIGGEIYGHAVPIGGKEGPPPPWWVLAILARIIPPMRQRMRAAADAIEQGRLETVPRRWEQEWKDEFRRRAEDLRTVELAELDDDALGAHLDDAIDFLERGQEIHFRMFPPYTVGVYELVDACDELLGWEPIKAMDLLAGLSEASSSAGRSLAEIATRIREHPDLQDLPDEPGGLVARLEQDAPELAAAYADHVERYAHRSINYDPGSPTLAEQPQMLASLLRDAVAAEEEDLAGKLAKRRTKAERRADEALARRSAEERRRFEERLERARTVYPQREDNIFWTDNIPNGLIRRAALEVGRRLAARGQLRRPDDVAYLELGELRGALRDRDRDVTDTALRRRAEQKWVAAHPGPSYHGDEPADFPDVRGLPEEGRRINDSFLWFMEQEYRPQPLDADEGLGGVPGSPGRYTGPARVITDESEFDKLRPGDVLVAPVTTPVWSVLFSSAGAVVTDGGGTLSHAAIVAREHGIPAVLSTGGATTTLEDGQLVTVDGAAGIVVPSDETADTVPLT